jgi:hypothetical protein
VRRTIPHKSVVTSLIRAVFGIVVGIALALLVTQELSSAGIVRRPLPVERRLRDRHVVVRIVAAGAAPPGGLR